VIEDMLDRPRSPIIADSFSNLPRSRARSTGRLLYAIGTAVVGLLVLLFVRPDEAGAGLALTVVLTALVLASGLFPPGRDRRDFGDVLFLASLPFLLGFGLRALLSIRGFVPINPIGALAADPLEFEFDQDSLRALALSAIAWGALFCGYRVRIGKAIAVRLPDPTLADIGRAPVSAAIAVLAAVGWTARIVSMLEGGDPGGASGLESVNALSTLLLWLSFLTTPASALASFAFFFQRGSLGHGLLAGCLIGGEVLAGLITGSRTLVFTPLVGAAAMAYLTGRYHVRVRHLLLIPVVLIVIGITDTYRNPGFIADAVVTTTDTGDRVRFAIEEALDQGPVDLASRGALNIALRYHGLYSVTQILRVGPPSDLSYGAAYAAAIPAALVPRFLWPDKPLPTYGVDFGQQYLGIPVSVRVSIAPTWIGDLMLNMPLVLLPLAMGALGVLLRTVHGYGLQARGGRTFAVLAYPVLLPIIIQSDGWISGQIWATTQAIAVLAVALALMRTFTPKVRAREQSAPIGISAGGSSS
jgi:hypothetical protein